MLDSQWYLKKNILMSFNVWKFSFNGLCDLKKLKKLISGSCPTPIIQSYISNLKKYIYEHDLHKIHYGMHTFFVNLFHKIQLFIVFRKWPHLISSSFYTHACVHPIFFPLFSKIEKPKIPFWRGRADVWAVNF